MWKNKNKKIIICPIFEQKNYDAFKMRKILKLDNIKKNKKHCYNHLFKYRTKRRRFSFVEEEKHVMWMCNFSNTQFL